MKVSECMSNGVKLLSPDDSLQDAAKLMAECDVGIIPIAQSDRLIGMVTDRDIVVRGLCEGRGPTSKLREVMTPGIHYCYEDDDTEDVARIMAETQIRRLPVISKKNKRLVGIVAIGDLARFENSARVGRAISGISRKEPRTQARAAAH
ncbi:MAG: CBS domain-containing protein [Sinimarinibacterium sp.]|jgi:CBS domain-containing protein